MKANLNELKRYSSVAAHIPSPQGVIGIDVNVLYVLIKRGNIAFDTINIDGVDFVRVPLADQQKTDWGFTQKMVKKKRGRKLTISNM